MIAFRPPLEREHRAYHPPHVAAAETLWTRGFAALLEQVQLIRVEGSEATEGWQSPALELAGSCRERNRVWGCPSPPIDWISSSGYPDPFQRAAESLACNRRGQG